MNIYTYFNKITNGNGPRFDNQDLMIDIWIENWKSMGFNPIVLNIDHARNHEYYDELVTKCKAIHMELTGKQINSYGLSCFARWLAYATQSDDKMIVSDYDVINNNWKDVELMGKLHIMGTGPTPCFASGSPRQFEQLTRLFVELTEKNISNNTYIKNGPVWHDQNAIRGNIHDFPKDFIYFSDTMDSWVRDNWRDQPLIHVSHYFTTTYMQHHKKTGDINKIRIQLMRELSNE